MEEEVAAQSIDEGIEAVVGQLVEAESTSAIEKAEQKLSILRRFKQ